MYFQWEVQEQNARRQKAEVCGRSWIPGARLLPLPPKMTVSPGGVQALGLVLFPR